MHALIVLGPNPLENWVLVPTSGEKSHHAFRAELRSPLLRQDEGKSGIQKTTEKIISQRKMSNHKLRVAAMDMKRISPVLDPLSRHATPALRDRRGGPAMY